MTAFVLRGADEAFMEKISPILVAALRKIHSPTSYEQAALDLNLPVGTVKSRVHRARVQVLHWRDVAEAAKLVEARQLQEAR